MIYMLDVVYNRMYVVLAYYVLVLGFVLLLGRTIGEEGCPVIRIEPGQDSDE